MTDRLTPLTAIAETLARDARPEGAFATVEDALQTLLGHRLFTVLLCRPDDEVERAYSSNPAAYPLRRAKSVRRDALGRTGAAAPASPPSIPTRRRCAGPMPTTR